MIARISGWYVALSSRERMLVTVAGVLAGFIVLIYGIVLPVGHAVDHAAQRHSATIERSGRLMAQMKALAAPARVSQAQAGPIDQQVAAGAESAGFVLQSNQPRGNDMTVIVIPTARPAAALAWIDALNDQGVVIETLTMTPSPDGTVSLNATLRRAGT